MCSDNTVTFVPTTTQHNRKPTTDMSQLSSAPPPFFFFCFLLFSRERSADSQNAVGDKTWRRSSFPHSHDVRPRLPAGRVACVDFASPSTRATLKYYFFFLLLLFFLRLYRALRVCSCGSRGFLEDRMMDTITFEAGLFEPSIPLLHNSQKSLIEGQRCVPACERALSSQAVSHYARPTAGFVSRPRMMWLL